MTETEIEELQRKSVEDHGPFHKEGRNVYDPVNENNKIKEQVRYMLQPEKRQRDS